MSLISNLKNYAVDAVDWYVHERGNPIIVAASATSNIGFSRLYTQTENPAYLGASLFFGVLAFAEAFRCCRRYTDR